MKLYDRQFVRALRRDVRREVDTRAEWIEIVRCRRWAWLFRTYDIGALRFFPTSVFAIIPLPNDVRWWLLAAWAFLLATLRAAEFQAFNAPRGGAAPFVSTPVSSREIFDHIAGRIFRTSLWLLADVVAAIGICPLIYHHGGENGWGVAPAALLMWLAMLSTTVLLLWRWPRASHAGLTAAVICGMVVLSVVLGLMDLRPGFVLGQAARLLLWLTPPGWASQAAEWLVTPHNSLPVVPLALLAVLFALSVPWCRALAERYSYWQGNDPTPPPPRVRAVEPERPAAEAVPDEGVVAEGEIPAVRLPDPAEDKIRAGRFLQPFALTAAQTARLGWIERLVLSRFREKAALLDYMMGAPPRWTHLYFRAVMLLLGAGGITAVASLRHPDFVQFANFVLSLIALCLVTPVLGGQWLGFSLGALQQRNIALLAMLPVDLRGALGLLLRVNGLRFLLALPCWLAAATLNVPQDAPFLEAVRIALELWLFALLFQPVLLTCKYSTGTNDTSRWYIFAGFVIFGLLFFVVLVAAFATIFLAALPAQICALAALAALSCAFAAVYLRLYFGQHFDLLAKRPPTSNLVPAE